MNNPDVTDATVTRLAPAASSSSVTHPQHPPVTSVTSPKSTRAGLDATGQQKHCKDCAAAGIATLRPAPHPGPRCATHHRAERKRRSARAHELRTHSNFGLTAADYQLLYDTQGGRCFVCQRATGATKRLAVDHEHHRPGCQHPPERGCIACVRALLCGPCNQILGRYDPAALRRAIEVLTDPPARKTLLAT